VWAVYNEPVNPVTIGGVGFGVGQPLALIGGPCVIESEAHVLSLAERISAVAAERGIPLVFKASFDKANRTSLGSYRGPGLDEGLRILERVKRDVGLPILTDVHEAAQAAAVGEVADAVQIPAFLSRQTDLLVAAARTGRAVNVKKGQFLSPSDMRHAIAKLTASGNDQVLVTERGVTFGYNNLVVDMRAFPQLRQLGVPVIFDVTHSLQLPGGADGASGGQAEFIVPLASAGVAAGIDGVFLEVHDRPTEAKSDGPNACPLDELSPLLERLTRIDGAVREAAARA
tara:strand:- start:1510 stop:2367 length:858 start_codon:yes stop_codon:yes gene_type:complete